MTAKVAPFSIQQRKQKYLKNDSIKKYLELTKFTFKSENAFRKKVKNISENVKAEQTKHLVFQLQYFINRK